MLFSLDVLRRFAELVGKQISGEDRVSEDAVRYSLFLAIRDAGVPDHEIRLEYPHPQISGAKLDSFLPASPAHGAAAWELKYDRATPSGYNQPRSNKAGALLNDV